MKAEDRLQEIIKSGEINSLDAAKQEGFIKGWNEALRIHDVVGQSESFVCGHPPKRTYLFDGTWHCEECGGKWESIANK